MLYYSFYSALTVLLSLASASDFVSENDFEGLEACNLIGVQLSNRPEHAEMLSACRNAYFIRLSGAQPEHLPLHPTHLVKYAELRSPMLPISIIPSKIATLAKENVAQCVKAIGTVLKMKPLRHSSHRDDFKILLSDPMPTDEFVKRYGKNNAFALEECKRYSEAIKVAGDGDCFYRSFLFGLIMYYMRHEGGPSLETRAEIIDYLSPSNVMIFGKDPVADAGLNLLRACLENAPFLPFNFWHALVRDHDPSDTMVFALRTMVSVFGRATKYRNFLTESFEDYSKNNVMKMSAWGDQLESAVLSKQFKVTIGVVNIVFNQRIVSKAKRGTEENRDIELFYTGIHYDVFTM